MLGVKGYALVAAILFCIGAYGALTRRHAIAVLISVELMLSAVVLNFVSFSRLHPVSHSASGIVFAVFIITVAAAEAIVALALILSLFRTHKTASLDKFSVLKF